VGSYAVPNAKEAYFLQQYPPLDPSVVPGVATSASAPAAAVGTSGGQLTSGSGEPVTIGPPPSTRTPTPPQPGPAQNNAPFIVLPGAGK
jgi:hypothetical protein